MAINFRNRRPPLNSFAVFRKIGARLIVPSVLACALASAAVGQSIAPTNITLDEAIQMALQHNHNMLALMTTIQQSQAEEITQNLRPNPTLFADWEYLPLGSPAKQNPGIYGRQSTTDYLNNNTEGDIGLSYLIERGGKRHARLQAQKDITAQTRSLVEDNGRGLTFQAATLFYNVQLAESTLELAQKDLKSFQETVDISEHQYKAGGISENDYLMIKLQLLQFESDLEQAQLARVQSLSDLRQLLGVAAGLARACEHPPALPFAPSTHLARERLRRCPQASGCPASC
jgi:cobalt-zinc-cadmium efflux system outer membrane protein